MLAHFLTIHMISGKFPMFPPDFAQNAIIMHRDNLRIYIEKSIEN